MVGSWFNETSSSSSDNVELGSSTYPIEIDSSSSIPNQVSKDAYCKCHITLSIF